MKRKNSSFNTEDTIAAISTPGGEGGIGIVRLSGRRALESVLSRNNALRERFYRLYDRRFTTVCEYFQHRRDRVIITDLRESVPELKALTPNSGHG